MSYKQKLKQMIPIFPSLKDPNRIDLLNARLINLEKMGCQKLVDKFFSIKESYKVLSFIFEIYIGRWLQSQNKFRDIQYEPKDYQKPPDFVFKIEDKFFQIEIKTITQFANEIFVQKLVKQIDRRISSKTNNIYEIKISDALKQNAAINEIVNWIAQDCISIEIGDEKGFPDKKETLVTIKAVGKNKFSGGIGYVHIIKKFNGLLQKINTDTIKRKIQKEMYKANKKFKQNYSENIYNLLFITSDLDCGKDLCENTMGMVLYGIDGIWNRVNYTDIDAVIFIESGTDYLDDSFYPIVFPNPQKKEKIRKIPDPFRTMTIKDSKKLFE